MPSGRTQVIHGSVDELALGALVAGAAIIVDTLMDSGLEQGHTLKKFRLFWAMKGKTASQGPITIGLASGLTVAEIAEAMVADPQRFKDPGSSEQGNRKVFPLYVIPKSATSIQNMTSAIAQHSKMINQPSPSWRTDELDSLIVFAFNHDSGNLTSGTLISLVWDLVFKWEMD